MCEQRRRGVECEQSHVSVGSHVNPRKHECKHVGHMKVQAKRVGCM